MAQLLLLSNVNLSPCMVCSFRHIFEKTSVGDDRRKAGGGITNCNTYIILLEFLISVSN